MKRIFSHLILLISTLSFAQQKDSLSLIFMGDIMGHEPQIKAAYNPDTKSYYYGNVFARVAPIIKRNDFAIANLEVTLAGKPYSGYPNFSSPDELAQACKDSGIGILVTANNHSCDRGKKGILRTIQVLDSLKIAHTGTFQNETERNEKNLLILEKNNIRVGILNYTYGTNGIPIPSPTIVNSLDTLTIASDIENAKNKNLDKLIACVHWGDEYKLKPVKSQKNMAKFLFEKGIDIIIGSHPHVLEPMEYYPEKEGQKERFLVYSLGNFISNQRKTNTDGGAMVELVLKKENGKTKIARKGYHLTWVHKYQISGKNHYEILPCAKIEQENFECMEQNDKLQMKTFIQNMRQLFQENNVDVSEIMK